MIEKVIDIIVEILLMFDQKRRIDANVPNESRFHVARIPTFMFVQISEPGMKRWNISKANTFFSQTGCLLAYDIYMISAFSPIAFIDMFIAAHLIPFQLDIKMAENSANQRTHTYRIQPIECESTSFAKEKE